MTVLEVKMGWKKYSLVLVSFLIAALFLVVAPAAATSWPINPGTGVINATINLPGVQPGDTILLSPGTYFENNIDVSKNISIASSGSQANTFIDGNQSSSGIFNVTGASSLTITGVTLRNGFNTASGGAIISPYAGNVNIISSTINNCTAVEEDFGATGGTGTTLAEFGNGGALYATGPVSITSSTITDCTAEGERDDAAGGTGVTFLDSAGGAVYATNTVIVTGSTIIGCSAGSGGALYASGPVTITSSTITGCAALGGILAAGVSGVPYGSGDGGAIYASGSAITITNTTFTMCTAGNSGGAVYYPGGVTESGTSVELPLSNAVISSSTFTYCTSANEGGAVYTQDDLATVTSSTFSDCGVTEEYGYGGAISAGFLSINYSTISGCSASGANSWGGALAVPESLMMNSTSITNCGIGPGGNGGAIAAYQGTIQYSRLVNDNTSAYYAVVMVGFGKPGPTGSHVVTTTPVAPGLESESLDATDNWWGTNSNVSGFVSSGVSYNPWLVLGISASPTSIAAGGSSAVQANLIYDSNGDNTYSPGNAVPDGIPVSFAVISGPGGVNPSQASTSAGLAGTTFTSFQSGTEGVQATVDGQSVSVPITVTGKARSSTTCYWCSGSGASGSGAGYTGSSGSGSGYTGPSQTPAGGSPTQMPTVGQPTQMPTRQPTVNQPSIASTSIPPLPTNTPKSGIDAMPVMGAIGLCGVIVLFRKNRN
ncbi:hypothetical protein [Methanoregula sp.]|uniref:hypothetical protein n=1 Tax=Methanoregula sp. TaxID=2052170 RepID=UPI003C7856DD